MENSILFRVSKKPKWAFLSLALFFGIKFVLREGITIWDFY